jgi:hypothetical protein
MLLLMIHIAGLLMRNTYELFGLLLGEATSSFGCSKVAACSLKSKPIGSIVRFFIFWIVEVVGLIILMVIALVVISLFIIYCWCLSDLGLR